MSNKHARRFWAKVRKELGGCWFWTGSGPHGYGQVSVNGAMAYVHRVSYEAAFGPIQEGMDICHRCDNPSCVNPEHLFAGTTRTNMEDMCRKGRAAAKLDVTAIHGIRLLLQQGQLSQRRIAALYGVTQPRISEIKAGKSWRHV